MITNKALNVNGNLANTALLFKVFNDKAWEFADFIVTYNLFYAWEIIEKSPKYEIRKLVVDGYAGSDKTKIFFSDIIARIEMINTDIFAEIEQKFTSEPCEVGLKELSKKLPSLPSSCIRFSKRILENPLGYIDPYFLEMKAQMELFIQQGLTNDYKILLKWAIRQFPQKEFSTLKSKAKSIFNWYAERGFSLKNSFYKRKLTDKELQMTRSENMTNYNKMTKAKTQAQIKELVTGLFCDEFYHQQGRWAGLINVDKVAKHLKMTNETVRHNLKELGIR